MKTTTGLLAIIMWASVSGYAQYPEIHTKHFFKGYPAGAPATNDLIIRDLYALSNNDSTKFADWVAYRIDSLSMSGSGRPRNWRRDPWLDKEETLEESDYRGANARYSFEKGHQAPLGALDGEDIYFETNFLSNITPQKEALNQGAWKQLEYREREIISDHKLSDHVIVYTGTLYERKMPELPNTDEVVIIPSGYWKIIIVPLSSRKFETAAFIFDQNTPREVLPIDSLVTIDEIERRSGLDFFWELEEQEETKLERSDNKTWVIRYFKP